MVNFQVHFYCKVNGEETQGSGSALEKWRALTAIVSLLFPRESPGLLWYP